MVKIEQQNPQSLARAPQGELDALFVHPGLQGFDEPLFLGDAQAARIDQPLTSVSAQPRLPQWQ